MKRHWCINGRFLTQTVTGVQRYGHEILAALDRALDESSSLTEDLTLELVVPRTGVSAPPLRNIRVRPFGRGHGHLWEQTVLPFAVPNGLISLCSTGPLAVRRQIVCIHDMNTRLFPESFSPQFRALYRVLIPALGHRVARVSTVSHYSASQLEAFGVCGPDKTLVIGNGHEHVFRWVPEHSEKTRAAAGPATIVAFGTGSPNKNLKLLFGMAEQLGRHGLNLAIAGKIDPRVFGDAASIPERPNVFCLGRVSDGELAALLRDSLCLAFPSFVEGFGLPPVEAMAQGCPTVVSNTTCLPEICGDAALFASPTAPEQWLQHFLRLKEDPRLRATLVEKGRERAKLYSWRKSAQSYLQAAAVLDRIPSAITSLANDQVCNGCADTA